MGHIIRKRMARLEHMGETRLEKIVSDPCTVHVRLKDALSGNGPHRFCHARTEIEFLDEATRAGNGLELADLV